MIKLCLLGFIQLVLVTLSSRITNRGQYVWQFVVSFSIGIVWCVIVKSMMQDITGLAEIIAYSLGSSLGAVSGIWIHKRWLSTAKESKEW